MIRAFTRRGMVAASALAAMGTGAGAGGLANADQPSPGDTGAGGTVGGELVALPPLHAPGEQQGEVPNPDPPSKRLGVAVVGLGHLALEQILPAFGSARHVRVAALVSGDPHKARIVGAQHGVAADALYDYRSFDRLRDDPRVDVVYVVLPNAMHREYVERAAAAGKHVLCEKPMATSSADAQAMIQAVRRAGRQLMIAYRMQYEPYNRALIRMSRAGELGQIRLIEAVNGQNDLPGQWRQVKAMAGGGSLPDVGLYCLNAARYVTGEEPVEITATLTRPQDDPRFRQVEDICSFTLRFPSGAFATCVSSYSHHEARRLRVMGTRAWVELDPAFAYSGLRMRVDRMDDGRMNDGRMDHGAHSQDERGFETRSQFALEMDAFAEALRAGRTPRTPGEEGLQDMRLIEAIYQAAEGGSPVRLPPVAGLDVTRGPMPGGRG